MQGPGLFPNYGGADPLAPRFHDHYPKETTAMQTFQTGPDGLTQIRVNIRTEGTTVRATLAKRENDPDPIVLATMPNAVHGASPAAREQFHALVSTILTHLVGQVSPGAKLAGMEVCDPTGKATQ